MKIDELLDKYFEGETSCEEERELRRFFTEEEVPEHLQMYRPLFAYLNREATSMAEPTEEKSVTTESAKEVPAQRKPSRLYRTFYAVSGIAAGLLLLFGVAKIIFPLSGVPRKLCRHRRPAVYRRETGGSQSTGSPAECQLHG